MTNYIVFGDVHGRMNWLSVVNKHWNEDVIFIFLGDYVSTHEYISGFEQMKVLDEVLSLKEKHPDRVILLRGNHDLQHLGYDWAQCSGLNIYVQREMSKPKVVERYIKDTQWIHYDAEQHICFSHAGLSETWMGNNLMTLDRLNDMPVDERFGFTPEYYGDYYGESKTQPPTWIRPDTLSLDPYQAGELIQVVGHTTYSNIRDTYDVLQEPRELHPEIKWSHIWLCDCDLKECLIIRDGVFSIEDIVH